MVVISKIWRVVIISTVLAVLSFFIFGTMAEVQAATYDYGSDIYISSEYDGEVWSVGQLVGGAIYAGTLSFDVKGIKQDDPENKKRQIFAMYDAAQPTLWDHHGYFIHFRKRSSVPQTGGTPGFQWKYCIDCDWSSDDVATDPWDPDHTYHFTFRWTSDINDRAAIVKVEDTDVVITKPDGTEEYKSWEASLDLAWPFLTRQQAIAFGSAGLANHPGFPAQPGLVYSNITLNASRVTDGWDDFGGYPSCEDSTNSDSGPRQDEPGTDIGDPYDDPNNPYDTCACTSLDGGEPPCEDDRAGDDDINLAQSPFSLYLDFDCDGSSCDIDIGLKENWNLADVLNELFDDQENETPDPSLDINFAPPAATTGDTVNVAAAPQNFRTMSQNLMFNWCLTRGDTGLTKTYNEMIANGNGEQAEVADPKSWQGGGCCSKLTRNPENFNDTDSDGDGMGDNWERRYFTGETINGVVATAENVLSLVQPGDDYDNDGYMAIKFKNQDDQYMTVTPALQETVNGSLGATYYPGGDDKLTNVEEYILGTNPTDGDTDNDGYGDDMDFLGVGALNFDFVVDMEPGPGNYGYLITVSAVGINENNLVGIAGRTRQFNISLGDYMQINLHSQPDYVSPGANQGDNSLTLEVTLLQGDVNLQDLIYEWYFNDQRICDDEMFGQFCDVGAYQITIGPETDTDLLYLPGFDGDINNVQFGSEYEFKVIATDPVTRRSASIAHRVPIVASLDLTTACATGEEDIETLPENTSQPIEICISQLIEDPGADVSGTNFQWSVDGDVDQANSGLGKSVYPLMPSAPAGDTQTVAVKIIDPGSGEPMGGAEREWVVEGPVVEIVEPPSDPIDVGKGSKQRMTVGEPGQDITFVSEIKNFPETTLNTYYWKVGSESGDGEGLESFNFTVPENAQPGNTYGVSLIVRGIDSESGVVYEASDSVILYINEPGAEISAGSWFQRGMAAVANLVPAPFRLAVQAVAIGIAILAVLYLVFRISGRVSIR